MSMKAVIIDDEKPARDRLRRLLADHSDLEIAGEAADAVSAVEMIDRTRPDVCFLDIRMPEGDGFEVLTRCTHKPRIIFTTAYDEYAVRAFEVGSTDYLLKPIRKDRLRQALDRIRNSDSGDGDRETKVIQMLEEIRGMVSTASRTDDSQLKQELETPPVLKARRGNKIVLLDPEKVLWFETENTLVFACTLERRLLVEQTLADLEHRLSDSFIRVHRSYLANLSHIAEILPGVSGAQRIRMKDRKRTLIPLSRRRALSLKDRLKW